VVTGSGLPRSLPPATAPTRASGPLRGLEGTSSRDDAQHAPGAGWRYVS
jgi:hypothetical protein